MAEYVQTGVYIRFTQEELNKEWDKYKQARMNLTDHMVASGGGRVTNGSIEGQSVSFAYPDGINSLEQWVVELENAQAQLDDEQPVYVEQTSGGNSLIN